MRRYPVGIQSFRKIREDGYVYIDKTMYISKIIAEGQYYFLSRPRRFGKSVLLSTIESFFRGESELFNGLYIHDAVTDWQEHTVFRIDLNIGNYSDPRGLSDRLDTILSSYESVYGSAGTGKSSADRLEWLVNTAYKITGKRVVVLIDEYDKPLLEAVGNLALQDVYRAELKPLYGVLKTCDDAIRFAMLTGVTKYGHLSVFSDLNNIRDLSMNPEYAGICGITHEELSQQLKDDVATLARAYGDDPESFSSKLEEMYDGYRFSRSQVKVFNPFSLFNCFVDRHLGTYWFSSGTPSYLVKLIRLHNYNLWELEKEEVTAKILSSIDAEDTDPIPVIYQSGYLTIKDYDQRYGIYRLGFPNREVREGFVDYLVPYYTGVKSSSSAMEIVKFVKEIENGDVDSFMRRLQSLIAGMPYASVKDFNYELHYQNVLFIVFTLLGYYVQAEAHMNHGRIDLVVKTSTAIYVMEFKLDGSAADALSQIHARDYARPYLTDGRPVILVAANFSTQSHNLDSWLQQPLCKQS